MTVVSMSNQEFRGCKFYLMFSLADCTSRMRLSS
jgi:hypothetical protein